MTGFAGVKGMLDRGSVFRDRDVAGEAGNPYGPPERHVRAPGDVNRASSGRGARLATHPRGRDLFDEEGQWSGSRQNTMASVAVGANRRHNHAWLDRHQGQRGAGGVKGHSFSPSRSTRMKNQRALLVAWAVSAVLFGSGVVSAIIR